MCKKEPTEDSEKAKSSPSSDLDFELEDLSERTARLRVGDSRNGNFSPEREKTATSPFNYPMGVDWEVWVTVKVKPRTQCLTIVGEKFQVSTKFRINS